MVWCGVLVMCCTLMIWWRCFCGSQGQLALHKFAAGGHVLCVRRLARAGADVNKANQVGEVAPQRRQRRRGHPCLRVVG